MNNPQALEVLQAEYDILLKTHNNVVANYCPMHTFFDGKLKEFFASLSVDQAKLLYKNLPGELLRRELEVWQKEGVRPVCKALYELLESSPAENAHTT